MYRRHISSYGYEVSNLEASKLMITSGPGIEREIPDILIEHNDIVHGQLYRIKTYLVAPAAKELQAKGYVRFSNDGGEFWLTEAGYRRADQNWFERFVEYLNKNRGLLALIAIICSIILALLIRSR
jgi:hypothetical protein